MHFPAVFLRIIGRVFRRPSDPTRIERIIKSGPMVSTEHLPQGSFGFEEKAEARQPVARHSRNRDRGTIEVVEMVLAGRINKEIAAAINRQGGQAVGLSGKDANLILCDKLLHRMIDRETGTESDVDLGFVGKPVSVNVDLLQNLIESDIIPVIAPIGAGRDGDMTGETLNINGDTAAGAIAGAMRAERLLLLTDVAGVKDGEGQVLDDMTLDQAQDLIERGVIMGGMLPKIGTAMDALQQGVDGVVILDGRAPHAVLLELFTEHGAGTLIRR